MKKLTVKFLNVIILLKFIDSSSGTPLSKMLGRDLLTQTVSQTASSPFNNNSCDPIQQNLCLSEECIHIASKVLSKLDRDANPCEDFYRFACGGWQDKNEFRLNSEDTLFYASNLNEMPEATDEILEDMIKGQRRINEDFYKTKSYKDMKSFWDSCMNIELIKKEEYDPALFVLRSLKQFYIERPFDPEGWDLTEAILELLKLNSAPFFHLTLDTDLNNSSRWIPVITLPKHHGLISDELFTLHPFKQTFFSKSKYLKLKTLKKFFKNILSEINNEAFYLEILSKVQSRESLKLLNEFARFQQRSNGKFLQYRNQYGKPNKYTSFFSRLIQTNSVQGSNEIEANELEKNNKEYNNNVEEDYIPFYVDDKDNFTSQFQESLNTNEQTTFTVPPTDYDFPNQSENSSTPDVVINLMEAWKFFTESNNSLINEHNNHTNENETNYGQSSTDSDDYKIFLEDAEEALEILSVLGISPEMHRRDLYSAIQEEIDNTRIGEIESLLKQSFLRKVFDFRQKTDDNISKVLNIMSPSISLYEDIIVREQAFARILNFITELRKCEPTEQEKIMVMQEGRIFNSFTIGQLQQKYPAINWLYLFNELLKGPLTENDEVLIFHTKYIDKFFSLLESQESWIIHHAAITLLTFNVLKELVTVSKDTPREEFCLTVTKESMNFPLSHMYLKYLGDDALKNLRREVMPMIKELKESAKEVMSESESLTEEDKEEARKKIDKMQWEIGGLDALYNISYVEEIHKNMQIEDQHFLHNVMNLYNMINDMRYDMFSRRIVQADHIWGFTAQPYTINAFYIQTTNSIVIPEAFFKPPYFYHGAPSYFKYGAAGMAFAHEMMHAFDFTGKEFDSTGVRKFPFSSNMSESIRGNVECFNSMVDEIFTKTEKVEGVNVVMSVDNNATMNENLADVVAIQLAYKAYKNLERAQNRQDPILPGLPYTREQLFFVGFAQPYCALLPTIAKVVLMEIDEHLIHNIRVNSLLLNSPFFAEAFQCTDSDRMKANNSHPTCTIF